MTLAVKAPRRLNPIGQAVRRRPICAHARSNFNRVGELKNVVLAGFRLFAFLHSQTPERSSRRFGLDADIKNFAPELRSNNSNGFAQRRCLLVGCVAASMRYHDEIRIFTGLMAKSTVGNNQ